MHRVLNDRCALHLLQVLARMGEFIVICTLLSLGVALTMLAPLLCVASEARVRSCVRREGHPGVPSSGSDSKAESAPASGTAGHMHGSRVGGRREESPESAPYSQSTRGNQQGAEEEEDNPENYELLYYV